MHLILLFIRIKNPIVNSDFVIRISDLLMLLSKGGINFFWSHYHPAIIWPVLSNPKDFHKYL